MFDLDARAPNIMPVKYRQVAVASVDFDLEEALLQRHFLGKEAYMRTRFIVVRGPADQTALVEVARQSSSAAEEALFSTVTGFRLVAGPDECAYLELPDVDVGVPAHIAAVVDQAAGARCVVVEGRYSHISFILNPAPLRISVLDIVPPAPSKLLDQITRILDTAEDLPPIVLVGEAVDSLDLYESAVTADPELQKSTVLLPCQGPGVSVAGVSVAYLDQRPKRQDWTLLGCTRSAQIHRWFYDSSAPTVDTCPRQFLGDERDALSATLTRCCLLQQGMETSGRSVLVPWGSSLPEVRAAIEALIAQEEFEWTPT